MTERYQSTDEVFVARRKIAAARRKKASTKVETLVIWTHGYRPFIMGGNCHYIAGTTIAKPDGPHDLGGGYWGYLIEKPKGTCVAEAETGAIVGETLDLVRADIRDGAKRTMEQQMAQARRDMRKVELEDNEPFWARFKPRS